MSSKIRIAFLLLVITQALHSVEEYLGRLWEVFPPTRMLSGLVSDDLKTGFIIINVGLFVFGLWCALFAVRKDYFFVIITSFFYDLIFRRLPLLLVVFYK